MSSHLKLYNSIVQLDWRRFGMKTVSISEFRANLLQYLTQVQKGERIEVTSKGAVLATLVPPVGEREVARAILDELAATARIGDVVAPAGEDWEAAQ